MNEKQLVLFRLGNEEYAVAINQVKEIIQYKEVTKLPNTEEYVEGIINLRGNIIPVIKLGKRLELVTGIRADKRALIVETAGQDFGIVVDEVTEVIRLQDNAIEPPPLVALNEYIKGIGKVGDRLIILLDVGKLFSLEEIQSLKKAV